ncbi:MAG: putative quinol monooxygenase [Chitinophagaceae bacterium]
MNTKPIYVFAKWQVKAGRINTVMALLAEVATKSRDEKGNLFYNAYQSNTDENTIMLAEAYADQAALDEHRQSVHFQRIVIDQIVPELENREVILSSQFDF